MATSERDNNEHAIDPRSDAGSGVSDNRLRVLSLFAGIGGIDLGLEAHGCTTVAYSEVDPYASSVMARHFPDAVNLGDITTIDWEDVAREHSIDIICGGFPCQDISVAGRGAGIAEGTRSGLWANYADAIRVLRPRGVLVENVAALTARGLDRVLGDLATCGYDAEWDVVPAAAVGAPHLRERLFVLAYPQRDELRDEPVAERGRGGAAVAGVDGTPRPVADADGCGRLAGQRDVRSGEPDAARSGAASADTQGERRRAGRTWRVAALREGREPTRDAADADRAGRLEQRWPKPSPSELTTAELGRWWSAEPDVGRVAHGVPRRVDRLRCLGNAVVPAVAEHVAGILINRMEAA